MRSVPKRRAKRKSAPRVPTRVVDHQVVRRRFYSVMMHFMREGCPPIPFKFRNIVANSASRATILAFRQARRRTGFGSHATYDYHDINIEVREVGDC